MTKMSRMTGFNAGKEVAPADGEGLSGELFRGVAPVSFYAGSRVVIRQGSNEAIIEGSEAESGLEHISRVVENMSTDDSAEAKTQVVDGLLETIPALKQKTHILSTVFRTLGGSVLNQYQWAQRDPEKQIKITISETQNGQYEFVCVLPRCDVESVLRNYINQTGKSWLSEECPNIDFSQPISIDVITPGYKPSGFERLAKKVFSFLRDRAPEEIISNWWEQVTKEMPTRSDTYFHLCFNMENALREISRGGEVRNSLHEWFDRVLREGRS